jgi:hypothetical protein
MFNYFVNNYLAISTEDYPYIGPPEDAAKDLRR